MRQFAGPATAQQETPAAIWEDFIDIFYAPSTVFRRRETGGIFVPLLILTFLCGVIFYLNSGALRPMFDAEFNRQVAAVTRNNPNLSEDAVERMRGVAIRVQQIGMFIFIPVAVFGVGLCTWLAGKLVDATQSFHAALIVGVYAHAPRILDQVLHGIQALLLDPAWFNGRFRYTLGVGRFLDPDTTSPLVIALLGRIDVITIWITALVAIGLSVTGRIPLRRAAVAAAIVWMLGGVPLILGALRAM